MQVAEKEIKDRYKSGFPKEVHRGKYNFKINERLKIARNRKKLSAAGVVKCLAKRGVSVGHSTLQGYEADENSLNHRYPSLPMLVELAEFYGCSLDYLFGITDKYRPNTGSREQDIRDLLESKGAVSYNGNTLSKGHKKLLIAQIDAVLAEFDLG